MKPPARRRYPVGLVLVVIVMVLGAAVTGLTWRLRSDLRDQILRREAESLYAASQMLRTLDEDQAGDNGPDSGDEQLVILSLQTSRMRGVLGVQVFNQAGATLHSLPTTLQGLAPSPAEWTSLRALRPVVRFQPSASLGALYGLGDEPKDYLPLLAITVPLHHPESSGLDGAACYVMEGEHIAREYLLLDRGLARQTGLVWLLASGVLVSGVGWVLRRLNRANAVLEDRTEDLIRANRELGLAAKTSALGTITAHLMHGLRNPIAGLEAFIGEQQQTDSTQVTGAWSEANATARRIRTMVNEVVDLMQEEQSGAAYELSGREVLESVAHRLDAHAKSRQIQIKLAADEAIRLSNRQAGLVTAILANLTQNACDALAAGQGVITLAACLNQAGGMEFRVTDNGLGLPDDVAASPFEPRQSRKPGGAGIGLAISKQLASHLGGTLELVTNGPAGASFRLAIPDQFPG